LKENFQSDTRYNIRNNLELIESLNKLKIKSDDKLISITFILYTARNKSFFYKIFDQFW